MGPLLLLATVRLHCDACSSVTELTGDDVRELSAAWSAAHYLPVLDEMDLADPRSGMFVCTWRRQVAA